MVNQARIRFAFFAALACASVMLFEDIGEAMGVGWIERWDDIHVWEVLIVGLLLAAVVVLFFEMRKMSRRMLGLEQRIEVASTAFQDMLEGYFESWQLSESERDVVMLLLKGCTIAEISEIRGTAEGTVKAQTNSIYKKSGFGNKTQLLSAFIEELTHGESVAHVK